MKEINKVTRYTPWDGLWLVLALLLALLAGCGRGGTPVAEEVDPGSAAATAADTPVADRDAFAFQQNRRIGRGVNLGNALEAPKEGEWGVVLEEEFFPLIKSGGFDSVRVPIRWNAYADQAEPYTIAPVFFERVDWVVANALKNDLVVILNIHHYEEIMKSPTEHRARFLAIWRQIAAHYQDAPDGVMFELLNEPNGPISNGGAWNELLAAGIQEVRQTNPGRTIIVGPGNWNSIDRLPALKLPEDDRNLIVTVHYYQPFEFTHQGAEWVDNSDRYLGTTWSGTPAQRSAIDGDLDWAIQWAERNRRPVFLGEFGAYSKADMDSRALWTESVARAAEARGMSWAYWEFCAGFGVYDRAVSDWVKPLHAALIPPS